MTQQSDPELEGDQLGLPVASAYRLSQQPHTDLRGLSERERLMTTTAFFARFCWAPQPLDPKRLSASEFLARI